MIFELTQEFFFEAAHTLHRCIDAEPSRRIHGHTYHCAVTLRGSPDPHTGMLLDLGHFRKVLNKVHEALDHRLLNEIPGLSLPTLESLCLYIVNALRPELPPLWRVTVMRKASGDQCSVTLDAH